MATEKGPTVGERRLVVKAPLFLVLKKLAEDRVTDPTDEMNRAVREMLEREGLWPPKRAGSESESAKGAE